MCIDDDDIDFDLFDCMRPITPPYPLSPLPSLQSPFSHTTSHPDEGEAQCDYAAVTAAAVAAAAAAAAARKKAASKAKSKAKARNLKLLLKMGPAGGALPGP